MYCKLLKPLLDYCGSLLILVIHLPVVVIITIINTIVTKGKPFFLHERPGKNGLPFRVIKFRTLLTGKDGESAVKATRFGLFLRKSSMDELPQLINVLKGEMSLAGPRPLLTEYLELYNKGQARRHEVKPGITGWAQVNGRNALTWEERFKMDLFYVDHVSFKLDIKILFLTVLNVLSRKGATMGDRVLCPRFEGTRED